MPVGVGGYGIWVSISMSATVNAMLATASATLTRRQSGLQGNVSGSLAQATDGRGNHRASTLAKRRGPAQMTQNMGSQCPAELLTSVKYRPDPRENRVKPVAGRAERHQPWGMRDTIFALTLFAVGCSGPAKSPAEVRSTSHDRAVEELADATQVLDEMSQISSKRRERARCVAVIPSLVRAGLIVGGRHGDGVVSCRTTSGWSAPAFISVSGGSAGLQLGVESSDVVMLVMTDRAKAQLFRSDFALGADASASAGPVGEAVQASTDAEMKAEILSYARSRGLFAGAELSGAVVKQDVDALVAIYGDRQDVHAVLAGDVPSPQEASAFMTKLATKFP